MDQVKILVLINTINRLYYIYILYSFSLVSIGNEECWRQIEAIQAYYEILLVRLSLDKQW